MMRVLLVLLLLLAPLAALADEKPARTRLNNKCASYRLCDAEADTGICLGSQAEEIVLEVGYTARYTIYSLQSGASTYSCDIFTNNQGYDAAPTESDQVNTASITNAAPVYTMTVLLHNLWINCSAIADSQVTIDAVVCPVD